jgi:hypothetical protein
MRRTSAGPREMEFPVSHKYKIGQTVRFTPSAHERNWGGLYRVEARLPEERGDRQYRIKSMKDDHQRVVRESQISTE